MKENDFFKVWYAEHSESTLLSWKTVHELTKEEIAQYQSEDGIEMTILRDENYVWVCRCKLVWVTGKADDPQCSCCDRVWRHK